MIIICTRHPASKLKLHESTRNFLAANYRSRQAKMKAWEFCANGQKCGQAIREIKADLLGKLVEFKENYVFYRLVSCEMHEYKTSDSRGNPKSYWRLSPVWDYYYIDTNDSRALIQIADGTYVPLQRAGGKEYDEWIHNLYDLLQKGVIVA